MNEELDAIRDSIDNLNLRMEENLRSLRSSTELLKMQVSAIERHVQEINERIPRENKRLKLAVSTVLFFALASMSIFLASKLADFGSFKVSKDLGVTIEKGK